MDIFAHCVYGMTACSRSGLAGGRKGSGTSWFRDRTVWWAAGFGVLPDLASLGLPFLLFTFAGMPGNFFRDLNPDWLISYRYAHSMLTALVVVAIVRFVRSDLFVPSLALPLHVVADALTHSNGKFQAPLFHPLSNWTVEGIAWWRHGWVIWLYWSLPVIAWAFLRLVRGKYRTTNE